MSNRAFWIKVNLDGNIGKYVTCDFLYYGWWVLISEVEFESGNLFEFRSSSLFQVQLICEDNWRSSFLRAGDMLIFYGLFLCLNFSVEISPNDIPEKGHTNITVPPTTAKNSIYMVNTTNGVVVEGKGSE